MSQGGTVPHIVGGRPVGKKCTENGKEREVDISNNNRQKTGKTRESNGTTRLGGRKKIG